MASKATVYYPSLERAEFVANELQKHDEDWSYIAKENELRDHPVRFYIVIFDEDGFEVSKWGGC